MAKYLLNQSGSILDIRASLKFEKNYTLEDLNAAFDNEAAKPEPRHSVLKLLVRAINKRVDKLTVTWIEFEDRGQDFTEWSLDKTGKVIGCEPFQANIWIGKVVINHKTIKPGDHVLIVRNGKQVQIHYPAIKVKRKGKEVSNG